MRSVRVFTPEATPADVASGGLDWKEARRARRDGGDAWREQLGDHRGVETKPRTRAGPELDDSELAGVRVDPAAIDAEALGNLGGGEKRFDVIAHFLQCRARRE